MSEAFSRHHLLSCLLAFLVHGTFLLIFQREKRMQMQQQGSQQHKISSKFMSKKNTQEKNRKNKDFVSLFLPVFRSKFLFLILA
jgi:uncharacterized membrane protein